MNYCVEELEVTIYLILLNIFNIAIWGTKQARISQNVFVLTKRMMLLVLSKDFEWIPCKINEIFEVN